MPARARNARTLHGAAFALAASVAPAALADTQTSTSFKVDGVVDSGGGRSTSTSHVVTSCLGSEIAGSQSSPSFRIDSGCGATVLAVVTPTGGGPAGGGVKGVPTLSDVGLAILVAMLAVAAARKLGRR